MVLIIELYNLSRQKDNLYFSLYEPLLSCISLPHKPKAFLTLAKFDSAKGLIENVKLQNELIKHLMAKYMELPKINIKISMIRTEVLNPFNMVH